MLTKKDYCDYDTCVALREMGYDGYCAAYYHLFDDEDDARNSFEYAYGFDFQNSNNIYRVGAPLLYQAQKWLREEKKIDVLIEIECKDVHLSSKHYSVFISYMGRFMRRFQYLSNEFDSYEEALSEGIKEAVKILKEDETIFR